MYICTYTCIECKHAENCIMAAVWKSAIVSVICGICHVNAFAMTLDVL